MNTAKATYSFDVVKNGNDYVFTYKKAKLGWRTFFSLVWPSFFVSCFLTYNMVSKKYPYMNPTEKISIGMFYLPLYTLGISIGILIVLNLLRRPGTFTLSSEGILLNGTLYPYKDVPSLYIKSPTGLISNSLTTTSTGFMVVRNDSVQNIGFGLAGVATQLSTAAGEELGNSIRRRNYKICFLFGNKEKVLARQMTQRMATQILQKIDNLK